MNTDLQVATGRWWRDSRRNDPKAISIWLSEGASLWFISCKRFTEHVQYKPPHVKGATGEVHCSVREESKRGDRQEGGFNLEGEGEQVWVGQRSPDIRAELENSRQRKSTCHLYNAGMPAYHWDLHCQRDSHSNTWPLRPWNMPRSNWDVMEV